VNEKNVQLVESALKEYYFSHFDLIQVPPKPSQREFGYQKINGGMIRHLPIKDNKELHLLLMKEIPSDVYCSNAYYSFPSMPMSEKDWKGADLIFDIDAKDLGLPCRKDHTIFKCSSCQKIKNDQQSQCPTCGSTKFEAISVACKNCISESKGQVKKLIEILTSDLGVKKEEIDVHFSGNEGFHVRVVNSNYETLDSQERSDLADYIMFNGALPETFGIRRQDNTKSSLPSIDEEGWRGRVAKTIFGSKTRIPKITREVISSGYSTFQLRLEEMRQTIGVRVDPKVTMDVHRIFRLEGSINSKSGFSKVQCEDLDKFEPFSDACLLGDDKVEITANCPVSIKLKGKKFGPYYEEKISLPKFVAIYMICKGLGNAI
jgi:DNA primase small subunit